MRESIKDNLLRTAAEAAARGVSGTGPVHEAAALRQIIAAVSAGTVTWAVVPGPKPSCPALQGSGGTQAGPFQLLLVRAPIIEEGGEVCYRGTAIAGPFMVINLHPAIAQYFFTIAYRNVRNTRN